MSFERLDMFAVDVGESADLGELGDQVARELAQDAVGCVTLDGRSDSAIWSR